MRLWFGWYCLLWSSLLVAAPEQTLETEQYLNHELNILTNLVEGNFIGKDAKRVNYAYLRNGESKKSILLVPGFGESYKKYSEVFVDFYEQGYSVFMFDLRGMGTSQALQANPQIIDVVSFQDYLFDLQYFYNNIVEKFQDEFFVLAGHSTGGLVATYAVIEKIVEPKKLILFSPLFKLNFSIVPQIFIETLVKISGAFSGSGNYILGASDRTLADYPIKNSTISSSEIRVGRALAVMKKHPELLSGGPSNRWVLNTLEATDRLESQIMSVEVPVLLLQAEYDMYVDNDRQNSLCTIMTNCNLVLIDQAKHEILFEKDAYRDQVMARVIEFLGQ